MLSRQAVERLGRQLDVLWRHGQSKQRQSTVQWCIIGPAQLASRCAQMKKSSALALKFTCTLADSKQLFHIQLHQVWNSFIMRCSAWKSMFIAEQHTFPHLLCYHGDHLLAPARQGQKREGKRRHICVFLAHAKECKPWPDAKHAQNAEKGCLQVLDGSHPSPGLMEPNANNPIKSINNLSSIHLASHQRAHHAAKFACTSLTSLDLLTCLGR